MVGITILGSTGSIGKSTLQVLRDNPERFQVIGLGCNKNMELLAAQIREFSPKQVSVGEGLGGDLALRLGDFDPMPRIFEGGMGQITLAKNPLAQVVVGAMVGAAGLEPVMAAIELGKRVALANKECIVLAGALMMEAAKTHKAQILPVDSEHNALYQSLAGSRRQDLSSITLTASGGPFRQLPLEQFAKVTKADALNHPNWSMGPKITVDSASMMNKGLEVIEAKWLFSLQPSQINVVIHPESIIHSMVTFKDGSSIAQLGEPDMRIPIAYCLGGSERLLSGVGPLDLATKGSLTFSKPDPVRFPALGLAYRALELGGGAAGALSGANEVLVEAFLNDQLRFVEIAQKLDRLLTKVEDQKKSKPSFIAGQKDLKDALQADAWGREEILNL